MSHEKETIYEIQELGKKLDEIIELLKHPPVQLKTEFHSSVPMNWEPCQHEFVHGTNSTGPVFCRKCGILEPNVTSGTGMP